MDKDKFGVLLFKDLISRINFGINIKVISKRTNSEYNYIFDKVAYAELRHFNNRSVENIQISNNTLIITISDKDYEE